MLVLGRKQDQSVIIGGNVKVTVAGVCKRTGQVKLAIDAPKDVSVDREEIHFRKLQGQVQG